MNDLVSVKQFVDEQVRSFVLDKGYAENRSAFWMRLHHLNPAPPLTRFKPRFEVSNGGVCGE